MTAQAPTVAPTGAHRAPLAEIGRLLAKGYVRAALGRRNGLAECARPMALCVPVVNGRRTPSPGHHGERP